MRGKGFLDAVRAPRWRRSLTCGIALVAGVAALGPPQMGRASALTVTNCSDTGVSGDGSLAGEVLAASGGDTITFGVNCPAGSPITLTSEVLINKNLTITGNGASDTVISGNNVTRVFEIGSEATVTLSGLTITGGNVGSSCITSCFGGGGVFIDGGTLAIKNSILSGNTVSCSAACTAFGGGIYEDAGALTISNSTLSANSASCSVTNCGAVGGGVDQVDGTLTITNSTVAGNSVSCSATNCEAAGGGIAGNTSGVTTVTSSTLYGDSANCSGSGCSAYGAGILDNFNSTTTVTDTIVANSARQDCTNFGTFIDGGHNLADDPAPAMPTQADATCGFTAGSPAFDVIADPLLGPLADNGGPTQTMALQAGSPAIGAGDTCPAVDGGVDQRGLPRKNPCDIGAYETQRVTPGIATTPNPTTAVAGSGTLLNDSATLSGGSSPTGTVTFQLFDPSNPGCSSTGTPAAFTQTVSLSGLSAATTNTTASATVAGNWHWLATYNGDTTNNAVSSDCAAEVVTVMGCSGVGICPTVNTIAEPSQSDHPGSSVRDEAFVTNPEGAGHQRVQPTGTVTFFLCRPSEVTSIGCPTGSGTQLGKRVKTRSGDAVKSGAAHNSATMNPGTYCFRIHYSGDGTFAADDETNRSSECFTITGPAPR